MNWLQERLTSNKTAGWRDWLSVPDQAQANMQSSARMNALQNAIRSLQSIQNDPQIGQVIQQLQTLMQQ
jgi:hypothetical protein